MDESEKWDNDLFKHSRCGHDPSMSSNRFKESESLTHSSTSDKASRRVLAPYLRTIRRLPPSISNTSTDSRPAKGLSLLVDDDSNLMNSLKLFSMAETIELPGSLFETADLMLQMTNSAGVTLYQVDNANGELLQCPRYIDSERHRVNAKIQKNSTVACHVAYTKKFVWTGDILSESRFPDGIGWAGIGIPVKAVICAPILATQDKALYVIELYRKVDSPNYHKNDAQMVVTLCTWMGAAIYQNQKRLELLRQLKLNSQLLEFMNLYIGDSNGNELQIVSEMMLYAKDVLHADESSFFILDSKSHDLEADWYTKSHCNDMFEKKSKVKIGNSILAYVAKTGEVINVKDPKTDERFKNINISENMNFHGIKTALCAPLVNYDRVSGVILLANKKYQRYFDEMDENIFHYFASYASFAMYHFELNKELEKRKCLNDVLEEIMVYHLKTRNQDIEKLRNSEICTHLPESFFHFQWYPFYEHVAKMDEYMLCLLHAVLGDEYMRENDFPKFIAMTKKCYRSIDYHNFKHAFAVAHGMACILKNNKEHFTKLELKALMVGCIIHDVDHRSYTNTFLRLTDHSLFKLYGKSALEQHHFYLGCLLIKDCNLFSYLPEDSYRQLMNEIEQNIMQTDLTEHFENRKRLTGIIEEENFNWQNEDHRFLIRGIMMTSSDLIGLTKTFPVAKKIMSSVCREFYNQGDKEKAMGLEPQKHMDRENADKIPEYEIKFISTAVIPCNEILSTILPNTKEILDGSIDLLNSWQEVIDLRGKTVWKPKESFPVTNKT